MSVGRNDGDSCLELDVWGKTAPSSLSILPSSLTAWVIQRERRSYPLRRRRPRRGRHARRRRDVSGRSSTEEVSSPTATSQPWTTTIAPAQTLLACFQRRRSACGGAEARGGREPGEKSPHLPRRNESEMESNDRRVALVACSLLTGCDGCDEGARSRVPGTSTSMRRKTR